MPSKRVNKKDIKKTLYSYVKPANAEFANFFGRAKFGSSSAYIDNLIAADRAKHKGVRIPAKQKVKLA